MKLKEFINELENLSKGIDNPDEIAVEMADCVPVVKPVFRDNIVFITDIDSEVSKN